MWGIYIVALIPVLIDPSQSSLVAKQKRAISFDWFAKNVTYQSCVAPGNKTGECKPLNSCFFQEMYRNTYGFVNNFCSMGFAQFGICCPNPDPEIPSNPMILDVRSDFEDDTRARQSRGCGFKAGVEGRRRIVGGRPADPKEWPWMAALIRDKDDRFCGGVLVSSRFVISAAHCTINHLPREIIVRLGEYDFSKTDESKSKDFKVTAIIQHPGFKDTDFTDDISILRLHRDVVFDDYIWPICLPMADEKFSNKTATVIGWGSVGFAEAFSDVLMEVDVPIWPQDRCKNAYKELTMPDSSMCAGGYNDRKDSCQGDSGGPLMHRLSNGRWVSVGIVSWGSACGNPSKPGIYTRVNNYLNWIIQNTSS